VSGPFRRLHADERGAGLVEALVASALLGIALIGLVAGLSTFAIASRDAEDRSMAQAIARAQAARIKAAPYQADGDYGAYEESLPAGFSRSITVRWWDGAAGWSPTANAGGLQRIALVIAVDGSPATTLEFAKAQR
jgi:Tfp pilus assembly protein PilV